MRKKHRTPLLGLVGALILFAVVWCSSKKVVGLSISAKINLERSRCLSMLARLDNAYTTLRRTKAFQDPGPFLPPLSTTTLPDSAHAENCHSSAAGTTHTYIHAYTHLAGNHLADVQSQIAEWQKTTNTPAYLDTQGHHKAVSVPGFSNAQRSFAKSGQDTAMWKQHLSKIGEYGTFIEMGVSNGTEDMK